MPGIEGRASCMPNTACNLKAPGTVLFDADWLHDR